MNVYKQLRLKKNLTQIELSEKLNVTQATVSKWEKGKSTPDIMMLKTLAKFFNVSIEFLLDNEEHANEPKISEVQTYSEKQKELMPLIQLLNNEQCQRIYDYICGMLDISIEEQKNWRCNE